MKKSSIFITYQYKKASKIQKRSWQLGMHSSMKPTLLKGVGYSYVEPLRTIFLFGVSIVFGNNFSTDEITFSSFVF